MFTTTIAHRIVGAALGIGATAALLTPLPAAAEITNQVRVSYGDLDLTSEAGQETLSKRIRGAVKQVCGRPQPSASGYLQNRNCKLAAMAGAHSQMRVAIAKATERKALAANLAIAFPRTGTR